MSSRRTLNNANVCQCQLFQRVSWGSAHPEYRSLRREAPPVVCNCTQTLARRRLEAGRECFMEIHLILQRLDLCIAGHPGASDDQTHSESCELSMNQSGSRSRQPTSRSKFCIADVFMSNLLASPANGDQVVYAACCEIKCSFS